MVKVIENRPGSVHRADAREPDHMRVPAPSPSMNISDVAPPTPRRSAPASKRLHERLTVDYRAEPDQPDPALIAPLAATDPRKLAFDVALLSLRLRPEVEASGDTKAMRGIEALDRQARLYEHLHILRTEAESGQC
ncbi:hypothetical protein [Sulfitobacter sp. 20_GPM-1509m]|uniref:hypothetical protein n=1 Tax=Sulfitobacter sp. 20_GPM-1509m TaxID=1380367 RepID=UPI0012DBD2A6|nr:hypothetical protein [Sulfitobacter sp. 20_GPM-1509m]